MKRKILEKKREQLREKRDRAKLIVAGMQSEMNVLFSEIRKLKNEEKVEAKKEKQRVRKEKEDAIAMELIYRRGGLSSCLRTKNEVLNIDTETKNFLLDVMFSCRDGYDLSMSMVRKWFEERVAEYPLRDIRREIFIVNERTKGVSYRKLGDSVGISGARVKAVLDKLVRDMKHPKSYRYFR